MATSASSSTRVSRGLLIGASATVLVLAGLLAFLSRPAHIHSTAPVSGEVKAYVSKLRLDDVSMQATENFMKQQVVEIEGKITNNGDRELRTIDVFCLFYDVNGHEIHREKVPVLPGRTSPMRPRETRAFRLPFDNLPPGWNQAVPKMVIAGISFAG